MPRTGSTTARTIVLSALLASVANPALSQTKTTKVPSTSDAEDTPHLNEIVVTATRRATKVQDTPLAITAVSGKSLRDSGITDPRQLSGLAPNLMVDQGAGTGQTHVTIRGQTSTTTALETTSPAAIYLDDVYQPFQFGIGTQIYDLDRIEILRGPQGTLFGKNTTAGSVNYYSQAPVKRDEGYLMLDAGGGDYNRYAVEGAYNKLLTPDLAMRVSFRSEHRDDYIDNLYNVGKLGHYTNYSGRAQFLWTPGSSTKINLKIYGLKNNGDGPIYIARGYYSDVCANSSADYYSCNASGQPGPLPPDSHHAFNEVPSRENYDSYGATLKIDQSVGDFALTSISNYQRGKYSLATNDDGSASDYFHSQQVSKTNQWSEELRLATPVEKPLKAILGAYAQYLSINTVESSISSNVPIYDQYDVLTTAAIHNLTMAGFGSVTYDFNKVLSVSGGARYTAERVNAVLYQILNQANFALDADGNPVLADRNITNAYFKFPYALSQFNPEFDNYQSFRQKKTYHKLTWDATLNAKPTDRILLYGKISTGFRSGSFVNEPVGSGLPSFLALKPENVTSYEIGFKTEWWDRKLRINGDGYYEDYKNLQVQTYNVSGPGLIFSNAATARIKGIELEVELAPVRGLTFSASTGYNDATYRKYDSVSNGLPISYSGNSLPYASKWTANLTANYDTAISAGLKGSLNVNWSYHSKYYFEADNNPIKSEPHRFLGNLRVAVSDSADKWEAAFYVNNVLNYTPKTFSFMLTGDTGLPTIAPTIYGPRRTFGGQLTFRF